MLAMVGSEVFTTKEVGISDRGRAVENGGLHSDRMKFVVAAFVIFSSFCFVIGSLN